MHNQPIPKPAPDLRPAILWSTPRSPWQTVWLWQRRLFEARLRGEVPDVLLLTEHEPVFTIGRSGHAGHVLWDRSELERRGIDLVETDRGGDVTYHGPGQVVGYPILDLRTRGRDVHRYLRDLEEVLLLVLADNAIDGERRAGLTGVWVGGEKVGSIGVKVAKWVTLHGFSLNVGCDLAPFEGIVACGIDGCRVTSLGRLLGHSPERAAVERSVSHRFAEVFGLELREPGGAFRELVEEPGEAATDPREALRGPRKGA